MTSLGSCVLYLHGRGEKRDDPPGDLVLAQPWPVPLFAPDISPQWLSSPFSDQVETVDGWLETSAVALGHSWGAWLLLCAAHQRCVHGQGYPPLLLLSAVLGRGDKDGRAGLGFIAPRAGTIREALGLDEGRKRDEQVSLEPGLIQFVHGKDDDQCPVASLQQLRALGFTVHLVPGGHSLEHREARVLLLDVLQKIGWEPSSCLDDTP